MFKTTLAQTVYKNDNGNEIAADKIDYLAPYKHVCDGFYNWQCGQCKAEHNSRSCGWDISGQVLKCGKCGYFNLLVRTNTDEISQFCSGNYTLENLKERAKFIQDNIMEYVPLEQYKRLENKLTELRKILNQ